MKVHNRAAVGSTRKAWHRRWSVRIVGGVVLLIAAIGIIAETAPDPVPSAEPVVTAPAPEPRPTAWETEQARNAAFVDGLRAINPALAVDPERAIRRAGNVCGDLDAGKEPSTITNNTRERFTGGDVEVDGDQAGRIVELVRGTVCA